MGRVTLRLQVTGRVQGVGFRAWTTDRARALGLDGWVRNQPDGSVAALVAGPEAAVSQLVAALKKGPPAARVKSVATQPTDEAVPPGFGVTR